MTIPRSMVVPVVVGVLVTSAVAAGLPFLLLDFRHWESHLPKEYWANAAVVLCQIYVYGPVVPLGLALMGVFLARSRERRGDHMAWYCCAGVVFVTVWTLWSGVVLISFLETLQPL